VAVPGGFPARGLWRRPALRWPDVLVVAALIALLFGLLRLGPALNAPFLPKTAPSEVSTDPANLPYYAVRSLLRMFAALLISLIFTFVYATAAARLRRAEHAPFVRTITQALAATADHTLRIGFFIDILRRGFSLSEARSQLNTAIDWGRYAELYDYDSDDEELTLEPGAQEYL
jgi:NitT/TauT family transport system permease protein